MENLLKRQDQKLTDIIQKTGIRNKDIEVEIRRLSFIKASFLMETRGYLKDSLNIIRDLALKKLILNQNVIAFRELIKLWEIPVEKLQELSKEKIDKSFFKR